MDTAKAKALAIELMSEFQVDQYYSFKWDRAVRRFGCCKTAWKKKNTMDDWLTVVPDGHAEPHSNFKIERGYITLSKELTRLNSEALVKDVILHEIAHAITAIKHGKGHHHSDTWKSIAIEVGCTGTRCYPQDTIKPPAKWLAYCSTCNHQSLKIRKKQYSCGKCCSTWNPDYILKYKINPEYEKVYGINS
tara:strand:+ start:414 stop:986 length:573 start_codon:yes stop_codon:yes gene_type:complete